MDKDRSDISIAYRQPAEPPVGEPVIAAVITLRGVEYPLTVRGTDRGDGIEWNVAFGDLADEGHYSGFAEALRVAHQRAPRDAAELLRATEDAGY